MQERSHRQWCRAEQRASLPALTGRVILALAAAGGRFCPLTGRRNSMIATSAPAWQELFGQIVVVDLGSPWVYLGHLVEQQGDFLVLADADAHDLRDTQPTREKYVLDARQHGVTANRAWVWVNLRDVVGLSRLNDVHVY